MATNEAPHVQLRPLAPGWIAIDWEHPDDGATLISVEREDPPYTWKFNALVNTFTDMGLEANRRYRYRVCAQYPGEEDECSEWLEATTLPEPAPYSPPGAPRFVNFSATIDSITVTWESDRTYSAHNIRWAEQNHAHSERRLAGPTRTFTIPGLKPATTYHFLVRGYNRTILGISYGPFSPVLSVTTRVPPPPEGVIYAVAQNGDLLWYQHTGRKDGSFLWRDNSGHNVGAGWKTKHVFAAENDIVYSITENGDLYWYRHDGRRNGTFSWQENDGRKVGQGWNMQHVFAGQNGVIYAIAQSGDLLWYRHEGREDGTFRWAATQKVGVGWNFRNVFYGGRGVIYAVAPTGDLYWYRHDGAEVGSFVWAANSGTKITGAWTMKQALWTANHISGGGDGVIYAQHDNGDLMWFKHLGITEGVNAWVDNVPRKVGAGWNMAHISSPPA